MDWYYGRQEVAVIWSDASLDEEEAFHINKFSSLGCIELEPEREMEEALEIVPVHNSFDKFIRDALHYLLCTNNVLKKPLRPVWMSVKSPFTKNIGLAMNVEQILLRTSLKAVFMSTEVRGIKDVYKTAFFVFFYRSCKFIHQHDILMTELVVIVFELFLYCLIEEMFIFPMKEVVSVITQIFNKLMKPTFRKKHRRWKSMMKYTYVMYSQHFQHTKMVFKTLGHPYDVFPIPDTMKDMYKRKFACMINTFYDFVPFRNFWVVNKEYKEEVANLDLTPDPHFKTRVIMRKADRRKKYRRAKSIQSRLAKRFHTPEKDISVKIVAGGSSGGSKAKVVIRGTESNDETVYDLEEVEVAEEAVEEVNNQSNHRKETTSEKDSNIDDVKTETKTVTDKSLLPTFLRALPFFRAKPETVVDRRIFPDESTIGGPRPKAVIGRDLYSDPSTDYLVDVRSPRTRILLHKAKAIHKSALEELKVGKDAKEEVKKRIINPKVMETHSNSNSDIEGARPKTVIGKATLPEQSTSDPETVGDAKPKAVIDKAMPPEEYTSDLQTVGGARPKTVPFKIVFPEQSTSDPEAVGDAKPTAVMGKAILPEESTSGLEIVGSARLKSRIGEALLLVNSVSNLEAVGGERPETIISETIFPDESASEFKLPKPQVKVKKLRKFRKKRETLDTEIIGSEYSARGSIESYENYGAVGGADYGAIGGEDYGAIGGEDYGAVGGERYEDPDDFSDSDLKALEGNTSHSKHKRTSIIVSEKQKQPILRKALSKPSPRKVYFDEYLPAYKPGTEKKKLEPIKKEVPARDPREVMSDLECYDEKDSDDEKFRAKHPTPESIFLQTERPSPAVPLKETRDLRPRSRSREPPQIPIWLTR